MIKFILLILGIVLLSISIVQCQTWNDTDSAENVTETIPVKPFVYYGRYHQRRNRRQYSSQDTTSDLKTVATILSILPLDRIGAIIGQIMATGLKEMLNPNVGKKIVNVIENQAPSLLTSLFTNLYSTFRMPVRSSSSPSSTNKTISINKTVNQILSNSSRSSMINSTRHRGTK